MIGSDVTVYSSCKAHRRPSNVIIAKERGLHGRCDISGQILLECFVVVVDARKIPHLLKITLSWPQKRIIVTVGNIGAFPFVDGLLLDQLRMIRRILLVRLLGARSVAVALLGLHLPSDASTLSFSDTVTLDAFNICNDLVFLCITVIESTQIIIDVNWNLRRPLEPFL